MPSDYENISRLSTEDYGKKVSYYGRDFADRYTERTHFIFELLQNAEDGEKKPNQVPNSHAPLFSAFFQITWRLPIPDCPLPRNTCVRSAQ